MGIINNKSILLSSEEFSEIEAMVKNLINKEFLPNKYLQTLKGLEKSISNLEQTNLSLKLLSDLSPDVLFCISSSGKILYISSSCEELLDYKPDEMIGNSFPKYLPQLELSEYFSSMKNLIKEKELILFTSNIIHKDGREIPIEVKGKVIQENGKKIVLGSIRDISGRIESDEKQNYFSVSDAEKKIIKILFVEDNKITQRIGLKVIQRAGYDADIVSSRLEILEAIKNNPYHIVLMDSFILEANIIEIAGQIKLENGLPKIIVITDDLYNNQIKSFEENGITDFIRKPLRYCEVEALLNNLTHKIKEERKEEFQFEVKRESDITITNEESITSLFDLQIKSDLDFFIDLLGIYLRDLPFMTKVIDDAIKNKDFKRLKFYTHKLEGSILNLGVENVADICHQLEKSAKKNLIDESVISLNFELQKIMHKVFLEISALREKYININ